MGVANNGSNNGKMAGGITGKGFKPGRSGNPHGRPKGMVEARTLLLHHAFKTGPDGKPNILNAIERVFLEDPRTYIEQVAGKAQASVEITGEVSHTFQAKALAFGRELLKTL